MTFLLFLGALKSPQRYSSSLGVSESSTSLALRSQANLEFKVLFKLNYQQAILTLSLISRLAFRVCVRKQSMNSPTAQIYVDDSRRMIHVYELWGPVVISGDQW